jgi:hypothetical protein
MKNIYTVLLFLLFHQLASSQQININMSGIIFQVYEGNYLEYSYYNHTTKKNYVEASDYINIACSFKLEAAAGNYPGSCNIYLSNDTLLDNGDQLLQSYRHPGNGLSAGVGHLSEDEARMTCDNFPEESSKYVIYKFFFDNYSDSQVSHAVYYKKLSFGSKTEPLLYYAYPSLNWTKQVNQGNTLNIDLYTTNNTNKTQNITPYNFYLCKKSTFDLPSAILIKNQTFIYLPTGDAGTYGNLNCDSIESKKTKIIFGYPLAIPSNVPNGEYYVYPVQSGLENKYECLEQYGSELLQVGQTVGINSTVVNAQPSAYPNPVSSTLTVDFGKSSTTTQVEIMNILGEKLSTRTIERSDRVEIDMREFINGVYFITVISDDQKSLFRILKTDVN